MVIRLPPLCVPRDGSRAEKTRPPLDTAWRFSDVGLPTAMLSMIGRWAAAVLASVLLSPMAPAEQWTKLTSSHFELFTTAGERKGREALLYFEQVRDFSNRTRSSGKPVPNARVTHHRVTWIRSSEHRASSDRLSSSSSQFAVKRASATVAGSVWIAKICRP